MVERSAIYLGDEVWDPRKTLQGKIWPILVALGGIILLIILVWILGLIFEWNSIAKYGGWTALCLWGIQLSIFVIDRSICTHNTMTEVIALLELMGWRLDRLDEAAFKKNEA